jgi:molybdopterin-guanine dinucleotide biosynthesis protein A
LNVIKNLIAAQRYQVRLFYEQLSVRYVTQDEIRKFVPSQRAFLNINTPDEFARIQHVNKTRVKT